MSMAQRRWRKHKISLVVFFLISAGATASGIFLFYLHSVNPPKEPLARLGPYLVMGTGLAAMATIPLLEPVRVVVRRGEIILKTRWLTKRITGFRVVKKFSTSELLNYIYMCPVGWRLDLWSLYGICSTAFGRAVAFSTPSCSDEWIVVEVDGKRYVICCEEGDREVCAGL
ncbi:hypothetical protein Pogu_2646 [Pyrobaculum oguniense TE7]|uniref:Bacterial Pleckstrin homology domain-containing protein n=1 Tax=Pyrobaculum oguniense (strain DSM 13380 / JCM 10595 / TE7) TaxID=698757 RepID=H6QDI3_PYROT|nr:hypothetical protein Pogu_2646 [Pyrobaculum oguniense TE7]